MQPCINCQGKSATHFIYFWSCKTLPYTHLEVTSYIPQQGQSLHIWTTPLSTTGCYKNKYTIHLLWVVCISRFASAILSGETELALGTIRVNHKKSHHSIRIYSLWLTHVIDHPDSTGRASFPTSWSNRAERPAALHCLASWVNCCWFIRLPMAATMGKTPQTLTGFWPRLSMFSARKTKARSWFQIWTRWRTKGPDGLRRRSNARWYNAYRALSTAYRMCDFIFWTEDKLGSYNHIEGGFLTKTMD